MILSFNEIVYSIMKNNVSTYLYVLWLETFFSTIIKYWLSPRLSDNSAPTMNLTIPSWVFYFLVLISTFFIKNKTQMQVIALRIYTRTYSIKPLRRDLQRDISPTFDIYTKNQCFENQSSYQWGKVEELRVKRSNLDQIRIKY